MSTRLSYSQLEQLWIANGGSPTTAPMAAAIALAESGGCVDCPPSGTNDWGLWQINKGGPGMLDPNANARTAIQMSKNGMNWRPWCTAYADSACGTRGGAYLGQSSPFWKYLSGGAAPVPSGAGPGATGGGGGTLVGTTPKNPDDDCFYKFGGLPLPSIGPIGGGSVGDFCVISRSQGRALVGAVSLAGGVFLMLVGAGLVLAGSKAGRTISQVTQFVPNPAAQVASKVSGAGASMRQAREGARAERQARTTRATIDDGAANQRGEIGDRELMRRSQARSSSSTSSRRSRPAPRTRVAA